MHSIIRRDVMRFILHPTFRGETSISHHTPSTLDTSCFNLISYTQGKFGVILVYHTNYTHFSPSPASLWCVSAWLVFDFSFVDGGLDLHADAFCYWESTIHSHLGAWELSWSLPGGHSLCRDLYHFEDAHGVICTLWEVDSWWFIQSGAYGWEWLQSQHCHTPHIHSWCPTDGYRESGNWAGWLLAQLATGINILCGSVHYIHPQCVEAGESISYANS